jgi:hypothetical protein
MRPGLDHQSHRLIPSCGLQVSDDAGPYREVNLVSKFLLVERAKCSWPPSPKGLDEFVFPDRAGARDPADVPVSGQPAPQTDIAPPPAFTTPVVHDVADLNAPGPKFSLGREGGREGDSEQSAGVGGEDASADVEAVAPRAGSAGDGITASIGRTASFHQNIYLLHAKPFTAVNIKKISMVMFF